MVGKRHSFHLIAVVCLLALYSVPSAQGGSRAESDVAARLAETGLSVSLVQTSSLNGGDYSADLDGDGLSNDAETNGWCNTAGCFVTDPMDVDSDHDALTDGEEKLFDTRPLDSHSPGIFVKYQESLQTR